MGTGSEPTTDVESERDITAALLQFFKSEEMRPYVDRQASVQEVLAQGHTALKATLRPLMADVRNSELELAVRQRRREKTHRRIILLGLLCLVLLGLTVNAAVADIDNHSTWIRYPEVGTRSVAWQRAIALTSAALAVGVAAAMVYRFIAARSAVIKATFDLGVSRNIYTTTTDSEVAKAARSALNSLLAGSGVFLIPSVAPTLVELTSAKVVSSATHDYVRDFIVSHESSAIGVAGPRGSGKSTLMAAISNDDNVAGVAVVLSAPVQYDIVDFTRRLFAASATELLKSSPGNHFAQRERGWARRRVERARITLIGVAAYVGIGLILADTWFGGVSFGLPTVAGGLILFWAMTSFIYTVAHRTPTASASAPPYVQRASDALESLRWEMERSEKSRNVFKVAEGLFELEDEDTTTRRQRAATHPDLVADFRELLREYSRDPDCRRFVIIVDELDKLSETDDLIGAVNGMKDLFHIPNVHFLVSVSTDALARFEERGLPTRDAFDSSFDVIVPVNRLVATESVEVIAARAAGFPPVLSLFCHAWSGGLPRELLRVARRCVELQRLSPEPLRLSEIASEIVIRDVFNVLARATERSTLDADVVVRLEQQLAAVQGGSDPNVARVRDWLQNAQFEGDAAQRTRALSELGVGLIGWFRQLERQATSEAPSDSEREAADLVAVAVAALSAPEPIRRRTVQAALASIGGESPARRPERGGRASRSSAWQRLAGFLSWLVQPQQPSVNTRP